MNIDIKVSERQDSFSPAVLQRMRRAINFLCDIGFDVNLTFKGGDEHINENKSDAPYMGGSHAHNSYIASPGKGY